MTRRKRTRGCSIALGGLRGGGHLARSVGMITFGTKCASFSSLHSGVISLISVLETCVYCSSAIRKTVSRSGSSSRLPMNMVNSKAMSVRGRTPRTMIRESQARTNSTAKPEKVRTTTLGRCAVARATSSTLSSGAKSCRLPVLTPTPTTSFSTKRLLRSITLRCPNVMGSKAPV